MKDLKFIINLFKNKDETGASYYLTVKAKDKEGSEDLLLTHANNKSATGAKLLRKLANQVKDSHSELIIEEYSAFSPGSSGAIEPIQTHIVSLEQNKPAVMENEITQMFGGLGGFGDFRERQGANLARLEGLNRDLGKSEKEKAEILAKLGTYEARNEKLKNKVSDLKDKIKELKWEYDDKMRDLKNSHDDELRKYKGQSAIITAGVQGLGGFLANKLNVSDEDLQGFLGMDTPGQNEQTCETAPPFNDVKVEAENEEVNI